MKVAIIAGNYGTYKPDGGTNGPAVVAFNLAKSLNLHSDIDFNMYVRSDIDPRCEQPNVERLEDKHLTRENLYQFDAVHVLSDKNLALRVSDLGYQPIIGTNVLFDVPHPEFIKPEDRPRLEGVIKQEEELCRRDWGLALVPNEQLVSHFARRLGLPEDRVISFPCGIDTDLFKPGDHERKHIMWAGPGEKKGQDLIEKLAALYPEESWVLKGKDSPFDYFGNIHDLQRAKIYISASRAETQGIATMEAMAAGVPVVLARHKYDAHDGLGYVERDPHYCVEAAFVTSRDVAEIKSAMDTLLKSQALRTQLGGAGRDYIDASFTLKHMADNYAQVLERYSS